MHDPFRDEQSGRAAIAEAHAAIDKMERDAQERRESRAATEADLHAIQIQRSIDRLTGSDQGRDTIDALHPLIDAMAGLDSLGADAVIHLIAASRTGYCGTVLDRLRTA